MSRLVVLFMGTAPFAVPSLRALVLAGHRVPLVVTQPDRPAGRGRESTPPAVKCAAQALGLPVWQPERIRDEGAVLRLRATSPDVIVVAAYGKILPQEHAIIAEPVKEFPQLKARANFRAFLPAVIMMEPILG